MSNCNTALKFINISETEEIEMSMTKYRILERNKGTEEWSPEKFYTGGWGFTSYNRAIALKNKLCKVCGGIEYKVQRII